MGANEKERERLRLKAEVFKAMGHPLRLGIIEFLQPGEMCVCDIVTHVGTEISNVSKHLSILKKTGVGRGPARRAQDHVQIDNALRHRFCPMRGGRSDQEARRSTVSTGGLNLIRLSLEAGSDVCRVRRRFIGTGAIPGCCARL